MSVTIINPMLTIGEDQVAEAFYDTFRVELEEYTDVRCLKSAMHLHTVSLQSDDMIVIFNNDNEEYSENVLALLRQALELKCVVVPVSLYNETRTPAKLISHLQSFEVVDQLRQRRLTNRNIDTIAFVLIRFIMSKLQPTMAVDRMDLFISHRRADGEELAAEFYNEFRRRADEVEAFRDLISIKVGQDAQDEIEKNLYKSDAVVFIDTPLCGESKWVKKELQIALGLNLPIVWVKIGSDSERVSLDVLPGEEPHFKFETLYADDLKKSPEIIDDIIDKVFQISRNNAMTVIDHLSRLQKLASSNSIDLIPLNKRNMVYQVKIPRRNKEFHYYQRPLTHVLQLFGRNPKNADRASFEPMISELGYQAHPNLGYHFDSGLLLGPNVSMKTRMANEPICTDSIDEYVTSLQKYLALDQKHHPKKGVIISGSFPDYEPDYQQQLTNAVFSFSKAILDKGGTVIFGSHPTFQPLILDLARRQRADDYINAVHMYISKYFVTQAAVSELANQATVFSTDNINNNRADSLTLMRQAMIADMDAAGIILLGGKQHGLSKPGIDEEFELAQQRGLPAFIIGSVGGRSSELAQEMSEQSIAINSLTKEQNEKLLTSLDYSALADEILHSLGF